MDNQTIQENISKSYYDGFETLYDHHGTALTNVYWSRGRGDMPAGTMYLIHGYGGSPVEPCMKIPMEIARDAGFDVVAIEGVAMSATSCGEKSIDKMNLARQKQAVLRGMRFCEMLSGVSHRYSVVWAHSISCRALSDLFVHEPKFGRLFNEIILNNPYFVAPHKVRVLYDKMMARDPSGKMWNEMMLKPRAQKRHIETVDCNFPTRLYNLVLPMSAKLGGRDAPLDMVAQRMSDFVGDTRVSFVLGTADDMAEYSQNVEIFNNLKTFNKELISIDGANHSFENALDAYRQKTAIIVDRIKSNIAHMKQ